MNILIINNSNNIINIENYINNLLPNQSVIISEFNYRYLLQNLDYFNKLIKGGFITCTEIIDNKLTYSKKQTTIENTNTTNSDNIENNVTTDKKVDVEKDTTVKKTPLNSNRRGRKRQLVESTNDDENNNKE